MNQTDYLEELEQTFCQFLSQKGYSHIPEVAISSRVDKTVFLVNSTTNLFKTFFFDEDVKVFAVQRCMRTQCLVDFYQEASESKYPSCFVSYGIYVSIEYLDCLFRDTIELFSSVGFAHEKMRCRVSVNDTSLVKVVNNSVVKNIELDTRYEKYAHTYGGDLSGRSIKIDYWQESIQKYKNLCYVIAIYRNDRLIGAEMASSDQLVLLRKKEARFGVTASKIADILPLDSFEERRFAESIMGTAYLIYENVLPNSSKMSGRILKKYLRAANKYGRDLGYPLNSIANVIEEYIQLDYHVDLSEMEKNLKTEQIKRLLVKYNVTP